MYKGVRPLPSIEIPTMLFSLGAFIVLMFFVSRFAMRPMLAMMKQREDHIEGQIQKAEQGRVEAEELVKQQTATLAQARKEAFDMIENAKAQKEVEAEAILQKAEARAEQIVQDGVAEIQREKERALETLRDEVGALTVMLASKVLKQEVNEAKQEDLLKTYLKEIGSTVQ